MILSKFDPPGFLDDLTDAQKEAWSKKINNFFERARSGQGYDGACEQFYNPTKTETGADAASVDITWTAFPRRMTLISGGSDLQRWKKADSSRQLQDEYCEWNVERDVAASGKITRVTFTCEGPEYWKLLADFAPEIVLSLYQKLLDNPAIKKEELFAGDAYNPENKWNSTTTNGAIHLIQGANTLSAEIFLAAQSSVVRIHANGAEATEEQELIGCGSYGLAERHSDPHIGAMVNTLARQKADVTLANPVGIYFGGLNVAGWETPDATDPQTFWKYIRGTNEKPVRAVFEVTKELGYTVGDVKIQGKPINFGAQIADFILMKLTGTATRFGESTAKSRLCLGEGDSDFVFEEDESIEDFIPSRRTP
jgi:hypothetical protein